MTSDLATDTGFEDFNIAMDRAIAVLARAREDEALSDAALDVAVVIKPRLVARLADGEMVVELLANVEDDRTLEDVRLAAYRPRGIRPGEVGDVILRTPDPDEDEESQLLHEAAERFHKLAKSGE